MICKHCSYENPDGSLFCQNCGESLSEPEEKSLSESEENDSRSDFKLDKKLIIGVAAALCAVVVLGVIIAAVASGRSNFITAENLINYCQDYDDEKVILSYNAKILKNRIDGTLVSFYNSADGKNAVILVDDGDSGYTIYHVSKSGAKKIADEVTRGGISTSGKVAYYIDEDDTLYTYDLKKGKADKIAEDVTSDVVISPNGKVVLYCTSSDDDDDVRLYAYRGGKSQSIAKNHYPVSASDDGKYIYSRKDEDGANTVYCTKLGNDKSEKIETDVSNWHVNCDGTELLMIADGKAYLSVKGKESVRIGNMASVSFITPDNAAYGSKSVKTFINTPIEYLKEGSSDRSLGFIRKSGKEYEIVRLAGKVSGSATKDGKSVYYLNSSDALCKIRLKKDAEAEKIADDIYSFSLAESDGLVYALDKDETLWRVKGKKSGKVTDDVEMMSAFGNGVLYITDYSSKNYEGTLYYSSNGKNQTRISDEVFYVYGIPSLKLAVYVNSDDETFVSDNGKKFTEYK